ncbi:MAG: hypothetical protein U5Q03_19065 [Bacteroidota bacterium]|nr:hypothetical protein [Bacteroidota bacterium]
MIFYSGLQAQERNAELRAFFVKKELDHQTASLSFNVLRIINASEMTVQVKPVLNLPEGWAAFSNAFRDTLIAAGDSISLPFRFRVPANARSEKVHKLSAEIYSPARNLLAAASFKVNLEVLHSWDVKIPEKRLFFNPSMNDAEFEIILVNKGNTSERISLELKTDNKATITTKEGWQQKQELVLLPDEEQILRFEAVFSFSEDRVFDVSKISIYASTDEKEVFRAIHIEKYSDNYSPFELDYNLPHSTELGIRTFSNNDDVLPFIKARGMETFEDNSEFKYNFTYYDLTETEDLIGNSYYNFLYKRQSIRIGLGAFSSFLGRNLYNRNSLMIAQELTLGKTSSLEAFASTSILEPNTSAAFGYKYSKEDVEVKSSVAYNMDRVNKRNTSSFMFHTSRIPLAKKHMVQAAFYSYHEYHYFNNPYTLFGIAWDLHYFGDFSRKLKLHLVNNYGTPDIPGRQKGLLNFYSHLRYFVAPKSYFSLKYVNSKRDYYNMSREGFKLPNMLLKDELLSLHYHANSNSNYRWLFGPSMELYESIRPSGDDGELEYYKVRKFRVETKAFLGRNMMISMKYGISQNYEGLSNAISGYAYDFHVLADYNRNGYGARFTYDYGPLVNSGLYQFALDAGNNSISFSPYILKPYLKGRVHLSLFTNYTYRFDLDYGLLNVNPRINTFIVNDWYFTVGGTYNFIQQDFNGKKVSNSHYYLEFSVKKKWGDADKNRRDLRRLKIQLFRDDNANGAKDAGEEGIPDVKVRVKLLNTPVDIKRGKLPVDLTLLSNEKGFVTFRSIPKGFYEVYLTPMADLKEYFFIGKDIGVIEVLENTLYQIPFQKSSKIAGRINLKRKRYTAKDELKRDLANIRVTAFNNEGNSYSALTDKAGRFALYAPGYNTYTLRLNNVFGDEYSIMNNDLRIEVEEEASDSAVFIVMEKNKRIRFKKATPPVGDTSDRKLQKIKVLPGVISQDSASRIRGRNALPQFDIQTDVIELHNMLEDKFYVVLGAYESIGEVIRMKGVFEEQGLEPQIGASEGKAPYYLYTKYFDSRYQSRKEMNSLGKFNLRNVRIIRYPE